MPKKDGREALNEIKTHLKHKNIPVIILTTSQADADISQAYQLGPNSFIQKPFQYTDFKSTMKALQKYWLNVVKLPT
jgi:CheY-like chemotaxis protein